MPAPEQILAGLADDPPVEPTPVAQIRGRARRRVRRRRALGGVAAVVVVAAAGIALSGAAGRDEGEPVTAGPASTSETTGTGATASTAAPPSSITTTSPPESLPAVEDAQVVVHGAEGPVADGAVLRLSFTGVVTGEALLVSQCIPVAGAPHPSEDLRCSSARNVSTAVQDGPTTDLEVTAFHDVHLDGDGDDAFEPTWTACEPCVLVVSVGERSSPIAEVPLEMAPTSAPIRPEVVVEPAGQVATGTTVTVRASGLQPRSTVGVGWCPTERLFGGGDPACESTDGADAARVAVDGGGELVHRVVVPAPDRAVSFVDCGVAGACGVGIDADDAFSVLALAPLTIVPG